VLPGAETTSLAAGAGGEARGERTGGGGVLARAASVAGLCFWWRGRVGEENEGGRKLFGA
jgi:hypothetical protein